MMVVRGVQRQLCDDNINNNNEWIRRDVPTLFICFPVIIVIRTGKYRARYVFGLILDSKTDRGASTKTKLP